MGQALVAGIAHRNRDVFGFAIQLNILHVNSAVGQHCGSSETLK